MSVWRSIHPTLNDYIKKNTNALRRLIEDNMIMKVKIRYIRHSIPIEEVILPLNAFIPHDDESCAPILLEDINMYYRSIILCLEERISKKSLKPDDYSTFELSLLLRDGPINSDLLNDYDNGFHWILDKYNNANDGSLNEEEGEIHVIKSYTTSQFNIEIFLKKYLINK